MEVLDADGNLAILHKRPNGQFRPGRMIATIERTESMKLQTRTCLAALAPSVFLIGLGICICAAADQSPPDPTGTWKLTISTTNAQAGTPPQTLKLKLTGHVLTGTLSYNSTPTLKGKATFADLPINDGKFEGNEISFRFSHAPAIGKGADALYTYKGTLSGDTMNGTITMDWMGQSRSKDWEAKRVNEYKREPLTDRGESRTEDGLEDKLRATGTGFFVTADGVLVTSAHVVKGAKRISIRKGSQAFEAEVIRADRANDIAILKTQGNFQPLPIASSKGTKLGESVFTVGFPNTQLQGLEPKLTRGEVNSLAGIQDDLRFFQVSVPVQPGNSGGPLLNSQGEVIGIITARLDDRTTLEATGSLPQNVNYALKSSFLEAALDRIPHAFKEAGGPSKTRPLEEVTKPALEATVLLLVY
jgi:S1-C subfamily serine protease